MKNFPGVVLSDNSLVVFFKGKQHTFIKGEKFFDEALKCIRNDDVAGFETIFRVDPDKSLRTLSDGKLRWEDDQIWIGTPRGDKKFPEDLYHAVLKTHEAGISYDRLVKFAYKIFLHPNPDSVEQLYTYLARHSFPLCEDGDFIAYKGVNEDFTDCHSGTFDNSPGKSPSMPREEVCNDRNITCAAGLHVAAYVYVKSTYPGKKKIAVKVNPINVVSVPIDHDEAKIRTCGFLVLEEIDAPIDHIVTDIDKVERSNDVKDAVKKVVKDVELKNVILCMPETENTEAIAEKVFVVGNSDQDISDNKTFSVSEQSFLDGIRLLKNKKSGYWEPLLELKRAYRKGLVKTINLDKKYADALLQLA